MAARGQRVELGDGGPLHHPHQPLGFHPRLRAAAFLLLRGEQRLGGLVASLRREVFSQAGCEGWETVGRALAGARWRLELPTGGEAPMRATRRRQGAAGGQRRIAELVCATHRWAAGRHLAAEHVVELLLLTLSGWSESAREVGAESATEAARAAGAAGWGPWVETLTGPPREAAVGCLVERGPSWRPLRFRPCLPHRFTVSLPGWLPEVEPWGEAEQRLRGAVEDALVRHRQRNRAGARHAGLKPVPGDASLHHFDWLALRQVKGWRPSRIAERFGVAVSTVHAGLTRISRLVGLPLRPVKRGPEEVLG